MSRKEIKAAAYVSNQLRFSPSSIARDCSLELSVAIDICDKFIHQNDEVTKWYQLNCPECGSYVRGMSNEVFRDIDSANCEDCGYEIEVSEDVLDYYYLNTSKKKDDTEVGNEVAKYINTPTWVANEVNKSPSEKFLSSSNSYIWHISDLHITPNAGFLGNGHSEKLCDTFFRILTKRKNIKLDYIVISGDCTDNGSEASQKEFDKFRNRLVQAGIMSENIITVPGNHDAWNGSWRPTLFFSSYALSEKRKFKKYHSYPERKLPEIFSKFKNSPSVILKRAINGQEVEFILVNTTLPNEMARGIFPTNIDRLEMVEDKPVRVSVMHHHLIDDLSSTTLDLEEFEKKKAMRVYNPGFALDYLVDNGVDVSLHGHNHFQYHKIENKINSQNSPVHLLSAPSLCENKFDEINGNIKGDNFIGFNVLSLKQGTFDLFFYRLEKFGYKMKHHANLELRE